MAEGQIVTPDFISDDEMLGLEQSSSPDFISDDEMLQLETAGPQLSPKAQAAEESFLGRLSGGVLRGTGYLGDFAQTIADYSPFNIFNPVTQARKQLGAPGLGDYTRMGITELTKAVGGPEDALEIGKNSWAGTIGEMIPSLLGGPANALKEAGKKGVLPVLKSVGKAGAEALGLGTTTYGGGEAAEALGVPREYGELAGGIFGAIAPTAVKKVAKSTVKTAEQRLTGFDPSKPGRLAGAIDSEGNLIKGAITNDDIIAEQMGKRDIAYKQLEETGVLDEIIGVTDNAESVSIKLAQANGSAGERIGVITDTLADIEKNNKGLVGSTTLSLKNARAFVQRLKSSPGNESLINTLESQLDDFESRFPSEGKASIKDLDNARQTWGEKTKSTYDPHKSAEDRLKDTFNNLVYGELRDALDSRAKSLGTYVGQPQIADDLIKANKVFSATKNFTNTAFLASQKGLAKQVAGDIIGPRFARAALYGGLASAGGPVGQAAVLADIARVAATDVFPAQTRALAKGGAKVADLFDIFSRPKAAPIAASKALELDAPATRMGQTKQLDDLRYRSRIHADLAMADKQIGYTGPIKGNPYGSPVITNAAGNPIHAPLLDDMKLRHDVMRADAAHAQKQLDYVAITPEGSSTTYPIFTPRAERTGGIINESTLPIFERPSVNTPASSPWEPRIKPGTAYEPFERGIINPNAKITKPSSRDLTLEEQDMFRRAQGKVTLPPTKQKAASPQLPLEKQPEVKPAESSAQKLKNKIDPTEFDDPLISDKSFAEESYFGVTKRKKWDDKVGSGEFGGYDYDLSGKGGTGVKATSERAKLLEWIATDRENGRIFSDKQMMAIEKAEKSTEGLAFKGKKVFKADSKATQEFADEIGRIEFKRDEVDRLAAAFKSPTRVNGVDISPHKVPDPPEGWVKYMDEAPLPNESGRISKGAAASLAGTGLGYAYTTRPKEKGMENIRPKDMVTAEDLRDAVIYQESRGNARAVSPKGATGLMQIMPETGREIAKELGIKKYDLKDPETNKRFGEYYLDKMLKIFKDPKLALAGYNAGPGNVRKWMKQYGTSSWDVISAHLEERGSFLETVKYVPSVLAKHQSLKKENA